MTFTDDELKTLKARMQISPHSIGPKTVAAIIARMEAAELKDCNQLRCGHESCNEWRRAKGL